MDIVNHHARRYLVLVAMNLHLSSLDMQQAGVFGIHSAKVLSEKKLVDARVTHTCTRHPHREEKSHVIESCWDFIHPPVLLLKHGEVVSEVMVDVHVASEANHH